jgi:hypothetical protein
MNWKSERGEISEGWAGFLVITFFVSFIIGSCCLSNSCAKKKGEAKLKLEMERAPHYKIVDKLPHDNEFYIYMKKMVPERDNRDVVFRESDGALCFVKTKDPGIYVQLVKDRIYSAKKEPALAVIIDKLEKVQLPVEKPDKE